MNLKKESFLIFETGGREYLSTFIFVENIISQEKHNFIVYKNHTKFLHFIVKNNQYSQ